MPSAFPPISQSRSAHVISGFGVALIGVFWAFDGWVYITWVAGEIKNPQRVLPRAMVMGVLLVGVIYLTVNAVYLYALPITRVAQEETIAHAAAVTLFSSNAARWLSATIALSCFGAMSCAILSSARVSFAMARDGAFFHAMGRVHPRYRTPAFSLIALSAWAAVLALSGSFDQLYTYVMFMMVLSYVAAVAGLFVSAAHPARRSAALSLHRISVSSRAVCIHGGSVGAELRGHPPQGDADRDRDRLSGRAVLFLLETAVEAASGGVEGV